MDLPYGLVILDALAGSAIGVNTSQKVLRRCSFSSCACLARFSASAVAVVLAFRAKANDATEVTNVRITTQGEVTTRATFPVNPWAVVTSRLLPLLLAFDTRVFQLATQITTLNLKPLDLIESLLIFGSELGVVFLGVMKSPAVLIGLSLDPIQRLAEALDGLIGGLSEPLSIGLGTLPTLVELAEDDAGERDGGGDNADDESGRGS
jgi:hypothetical protein